MVVGVGGAAILALIAVIIWRHMRKENEAKQNMSNLTYFSDEDPAQGSVGSPTGGFVRNGGGSPQGGELRSPAVNAAANF